jgi:NAD(P)H-hydrate epimerase
MLAVEGPRPAAVINADRFGAARLAASRFDATVLLKGAGTVVATPDGRAWSLPYAEPTLGVAGSGDVLAGAVGARLAEEGDALRATLQAAHAHGLAGATLRAQRGAVRGTLASEIADALSACLDVTHP